MHFPPIKQPMSLTLVVCLMAVLTSLPVAAQQQRTVTVRSQDYGYFYYRVDTGNRVRLTRQLSRNPCDYQRSWGYDHRGVWVDKGCEGEFEVGGGSYNNPSAGTSGDGRREIYVYSPNYHYYKYNINTDNEVELVSQLSQSPCTKNSTWGFDREGVWVNQGCSGQFLVGKKPGGSKTGRNVAIGSAIAGGVILAAILAARAKNNDEKADNSGDTGQPGSVERGVYDQAYELGQRDRAEGRNKDYSRYRNDFESRYDAYVKRGYERGYEAGGGSNDSRPNDQVPYWLVGSFRGFNPVYNSDVQLTIYSSGSVVVGLSDGQSVGGSYRNGRLEVGNFRFTVTKERNGFRTTQIGNSANQVTYRRVY